MKKPDENPIHHLYDHIQVNWNKLNAEANAENRQRFIEAIEMIDQSNPMLPIAIYIMDVASATMVAHNDCFQKWFGHPPESAFMSWLYDRIHLDDLKAVIRHVELHWQMVNDFPQVREELTSIQYHINLRMRMADGSYRDFERRTRFLDFDTDKNLQHTIGIFTDITHLNKSKEIQTFVSGINLETYGVPDDYFKVASSSHSFTDRQLDVLRLLKQGKTSKDIAEALFISENTVNFHRKNLLRLTNASNTAELLSSVAHLID